MRRRALLKEPTSQSICIFCAHRFNGARQSSSYIPRRSLHSARVLSKPPGAAAAAQKSNGDGVTYTSADAKSPQSRNGDSVSSVPSKAGFGSPTFGSKPAFATSTPNFGSKPTFGASPGFGSKPTFGAGAPTFGGKPTFGANAPTFGANPSFGSSPSFGGSTPSSSSTAQGLASQSSASMMEELTPAEKKARELIMQKHLEERRRQLVDVHGGPGPESSRAGRFVGRGPEERNALDEKNKLREQARQFAQTNKEYVQNGPRYKKVGSSNMNDGLDHLGLKNKHEILDSQTKSASSFGDSRDTGYIQSGNWTHLKKRGQESSREQESSLSQPTAKERALSEFVRARAEREAQATSAKYVPLVSRFEYERRVPLGRRRAETESITHASGSSTGSRRPVEFHGRTEFTGEQSEFRPRATYTPQGHRSEPIQPGAWRDKPQDDRLRRIVRQEAGNVSNSGARDASHSVKDRKDGSDGPIARDRSTAGKLSSYRPSENGFSGYEATRSEITRSEATGSALTKDSFSGYEATRSETTNNTFSGYEAIRSETTTPSFEGYEISRPLGESAKSEKTRYSSRPPPRLDEIPRGKERDRAKRREQFVASYEEADDEAAQRAELKRQRKLEKAAKKAAALTPILLPEWISVSNLATALKIRLDDFAVKLEELGFIEMTHDFILGAEDAGLIAQEYGFEPIIDRDEGEDLKARPPAEDVSALPPRPPVVTIMGHVDHGKTTLLDWLRKSSVAASEHGGITQHIGAFSVPMPSGKIITFLDTPGHEAFLSMRQRGANVTDIVILVVAADDSVKPQTIEAINHAKAAKVPVIVAINKVDKEDADAQRVKQDLARHGIEVEDFGGETQVVCVSGKTGQGMPDLEEAIVTLSEIIDMRAETDGQAEGWVIEASIKSMGKVATVLVKRGTMKLGDFIVAGKTWARIRCLRSEGGVEIAEAGPGTPVEIDGWREQPLAGDEVLQAPDENVAKRAVEYRLEKEEREKMAADMEAINEIRKNEQEKREREKREALIAAGELVEEETVETEAEPLTPGVKQVYFIVKGDVSGSVEAVVDSISSLGTNEVRAYILRSGVGQLTEFDVEHATVAKGHLINFNTEVDPNISARAAKAGVMILDHNVIYKLVDEVREKLSEQLPPIISQTVTAEAEVAKIFDITIKGRKKKPIAGCKVRLGVVKKASKVRVMRAGEKIFDGKLATLKNVKRDVTEMHKGAECGIEFEDWGEFQEGDLIQCYDEIKQKRYL